MADQNNPRQYRAYDPRQRAGMAGDGQPNGGSDPLAELARLIGQNDPFIEFERNLARGDVQHGHPAQTPHSQDWAPEPAPPPEAYGPGPGLDADASAAAQTAAHYPHAHPAQHPAAAYEQYPDQGAAYPADANQQDYDPYDDADGLALDEAEYHEQQERKRRRRRLATVIAILVLAVVGGAGAYGYRAFFGPVDRASPPPVIKADTTPTKVIPAVQAGETASNKLIYDRVGERNQTEKVVPREETPVDIRTATVSQAPRAVYPAPDANAMAALPPATIPVTGRNAGGQVLPVASEPSVAVTGSGAILPSAKKVRTVTIRPDMTVVPSATAGGTEPAAPAAPPVRAAEAAPPPPNAGPTRAVPPRQTAAAPLSLSPGNVSAPAPRAPVWTTPAATPQALASVPPAAPNESRTAATGGYAVQVSSQRSETDANASFRALQSRYPNVLGGRSSFIRRADLGSRGVYYRALVGPFATADEAAQFCSSLKAAGGQCVIHRN